MSYTVLARRYRSDSFDDVIGQEAIAQTLKNAIETDRVAHAYLFTGTRGVGKTSMARILAKALNCLSFDAATTTPCCKCESCMAISEGTDIDVLEIDGASNNGVEHIRELRQNAIYRPARARYKIYIIDEVHMLSTSAFNALLKTLEEPPEHVKFIFATTESNKILPTILSRCQRFDFRNIQLDNIAKHLQGVLETEGVQAEPSMVRRVARLANGSMRDGLSLLDQMLSMSAENLTLDMLMDLMGTPRSDRIIELVDAINQSDLSASLSLVDRALCEGLALEQLTDALQDHFRDLMVMRNCGSDTEMVDTPEPSVRERMAQQSQQFDDATLVYYITIMEELRRSLKSSGAGRALLEATIVRLTASEKFSDTKALLNRLKQLQSGTTSGSSRGSSGYTRPTPVRSATESAPARQPAPVSAPPSAQTPSTAPPSPAKPIAKITLPYLPETWPELLTKLGDHGAKTLTSYLTPSTPSTWNNNTITLNYAEKDMGTASAFNALASNRVTAEKALSAILGQDVKIEIRLPEKKNGEASPVTTPTAPQASKITSPGAKPSQEENNSASTDPKVVLVLEHLGGKVMDIKRLNN